MIAKKTAHKPLTYHTYRFKSGKRKGMTVLDAYKQDRQFVIWLAIECTFIPLKNMARQLLIDFEQAECELEEEPAQLALPMPLYTLGEVVHFAQEGRDPQEGVIADMNLLNMEWVYQIELLRTPGMRLCVLEAEIGSDLHACPF